MKPLFSILAALSLSTAAIAHEYSAGGLDIDHPMAFETAATAKVGGGYMTITNTGESADALNGVKADFPRVMIHLTKIRPTDRSIHHLESRSVLPAPPAQQGCLPDENRETRGSFALPFNPRRRRRLSQPQPCRQCNLER